MKTIPITLFGALILLANPAAVTTATAASSEISNIDPALSAKIAREKGRQRIQRRKSRKLNNQDDCGTVDIGNNDNDSRTARGRLNPRNTTIVVTGPIINAANCK